MPGYQSPYTGAQIDAALDKATTALQPGDVDDTPVNGVTDAPVSSNWAFDHAANLNAHGISDFGETLVDDADAAAARITLGAASDDLDNITLSRPSIRPSLLLDFANAKTLDPRITFTRDAVGTYYDGKTVAKAEENLVLESQTFDSASWTKNDVSVTANSTVAPDGTSTADSLIENSATAVHRVRQISPIATGSHQWSVYAKANTRSWVTLGISDNVNYYRAWFNLSTGTVGTVEGGLAASITDAGNGWYRCSLYIANAVAVSNSTKAIEIATGDNVFSYAGDGASGIYIWGAQLEQRSSVTAYTPTTSQPITNYLPVLQSAAANVARFDHDPITGESKGLLIEEQRSNLLTYSEDFSNGSWIKSAVSIAANTVVAPDGTLTGDKINESATTAGHSVYKNIAVTSGTTYTLSCFFKKGERGFGWIKFSDNVTNWGQCFNLTTGQVGNGVSGFTAPTTSAITDVGNGWYRCTITMTAANTATGGHDIGVMATDGTRVYTGDGYSGIYLWGAQLEAGAFPTSYIKTASAQVTRAADAASMTGTNFSSWFNNAEGSFYASINAKALAVSSGIQANDNTTNNRLRLAITSTSDQGTVTTNGTAQATMDGGTPAVDTATKLTLSYKANDFGLSLNGGTIATDTSGTVPVCTQLQLGAETTTVGNLHLKKVAYWPKKLTSAELVALTA